MRTTKMWRSLVVVISGIVLLGCKDLTAKLPAGTVDPSFYQSEEAAYRMAETARVRFSLALMDAVRVSGGLSDELRAHLVGGPIGFFTGVSTEIDSRLLPENRIPRQVDQIRITKWEDSQREFGGYKKLQVLRSDARLARFALLAYAPTAPAAMRARLFLYEGYAEILLADLFCSGIPLTTVDFEQDFTYRPGSSTHDVYQHAIGLLDSARRLGEGVDSLVHAARVATARALLGMGQIAEAASMVAGVPSDFHYRVPIFWGTSETGSIMFTDWPLGGNGWGEESTPTGSLSLDRSEYPFRFVADREGGNGLPFVSAKDPRVPLRQRVANAVNFWSVSDWLPAPRTSLIIANHIEARLIEAEAAVAAGRPDWLTILNTLRTDQSFTNSGSDTLWGAGTGGVAGLAPLTDPALAPLPPGKTADAVRLDLVMRERAFWLFLGARRQGDLRRLVREYRRPIASTYPSGEYLGGTGEYHDFIDLPIPESERFNPYFQGCLGRDS